MSSEMRRATWSGVDGRLVLRRARRVLPIVSEHDEAPGPASQVEAGVEGDAVDD